MSDPTNSAPGASSQERTDHTPEPWVQWADKPIIFAGPLVKNTPSVASGGRGRVADCDDDDLCSPYVGSANARRIVACVNACAGMIDPTAAIAKLKRVREAAARYVEAWDKEDPSLRAVFADLLTALAATEHSHG